MKVKIVKLLLEFLSGLSGNLIAAWIQQDALLNLFTRERVLATILFAGCSILIISYIDTKIENNDKPESRKLRRRLSKKSQLNKFKVETHSDQNRYDIVVVHSDLDRGFSLQLIDSLRSKNLMVWEHEFEIGIGDSVRERIDQGLLYAKYGLVILSKSLFDDVAARKQLNALLAREMTGAKVVLPIWYDLEFADILNISPLLADKFALSARQMSLDRMADSIYDAVKRGS